jgi:multiple sugar transport system permease protein
MICLMQKGYHGQVLGWSRRIASCAVVALFMFPLFWWGLTSVMPASAVFNRDGVVLFDFQPTLDNYRVTLLGQGPDALGSQKTIVDTIIVALGSTSLALFTGLLAGFGLSFHAFKWRRAYLYWLFFQRVLPPIAILVPLVGIFHATALLDTRLGLILAHASMNLPLATLLLKSFFDDVPREMSEAAMIDGATVFQNFARVSVPMIRSGIATTAVLCFIFSWTEFLMSLFLTSSIRMLPVQLSILRSSAWDWGLTAALSTVALLPAFVLILLTQRYLVRGLTLGLQKD